MTSKEMKGQIPRNNQHEKQIGQKRMLFNETQDEYQESKMMMPPYLDHRALSKQHSQNQNIFSKQVNKSSKGSPDQRTFNHSNSSQQLRLTYKGPKEQIKNNQKSGRTQQVQHGQQFDYEGYESDSEEFSLTNFQDQDLDEILNVDFQMMYLMTMIENSLNELEEQNILQETILQDIPRLRYILIHFHRKAIYKSVNDEGQFDLDKYKQLLESQDTLYHFLFMEYPYLEFEVDQESQIAKYQLMDDEQFEDEYRMLHQEQKIREIIEYAELIDHLNDQYVEDCFSPYQIPKKQPNFPRSGPLDSVMTHQNLFDNIDKFSKDQNTYKMNKPSQKKHDVSIRRQKQNPKQQDVKTKKSNQVQLFNMSSISFAQSNTQNEQKNINPSSLTYQQFVSLLQRQKESKKAQTTEKLSEQNKKSHFDAILGRKPDQVSENYLKPYIGEFSKKQINKHKDLFNQDKNIERSDNVIDYGSQKATSNQKMRNGSKEANLVLNTNPCLQNGENLIPFSKEPQLTTGNVLREAQGSNPNSKNSANLQQNIFTSNNNIHLIPNAVDNFQTSPPSISNTTQPSNQTVSNQVKFVQTLNNPAQQNILPNPFSAIQNQQTNSPNQYQTVNNPLQDQTPNKNPFQRNPSPTARRLDNVSCMNPITSSPQTPTFGLSQSLGVSTQVISAQRNPFSSAIRPTSSYQNVPTNLTQQPSQHTPFNQVASNHHLPNVVIIPPNQQNSVIPKTQIDNPLKGNYTLNSFQNNSIRPQQPGIANPHLTQNPNLKTPTQQNKLIKKDEVNPLNTNVSFMSPQKELEQIRADGTLSQGENKKIGVNNTQKQQKKNIYNDEQIMKMKTKDFLNLFCPQQMCFIYRQLFGELMICRKWKIWDLGLQKEFYQKINYLEKFRSQIFFSTKRAKAICKNRTENPQSRQKILQLQKLSTLEQPYLLMNRVSAKLNNAIQLSLSTHKNNPTESPQNTAYFSQSKHIKANQTQTFLLQTQNEFNLIQQMQDKISQKLDRYEQNLANIIRIEEDQNQIPDQTYLTMNEELASMIKAIRKNETWLLERNLCTVSNKNKTQSYLISAQNIRKAQNQEQNQTKDFQALKLIYGNLNIIETNIQLMSQKLSQMD